jgi:trehalose 6-phosphate phosphatase
MSVPLLPRGWEQVGTQVRSAAGIALFLDFDGTLSPLVANPGEARVDRATRVALARLARNPRVHACIISGRRSDDLRARIALPGLRYLGVHGADTGKAISGPPDFAPEVLRRVSEARRELIASLNGTAGVQVEDKRVGFALHYRGAGSEAARHAGGLLVEIVARSHGQLRILPGDCVWEVLPSEIRGKGQAAWKQWRAWGTRTLPMYVGNDATDEAAFQTLSSGITVRVGAAHSSKAHYSLRNPAEVRWFLIQLEKEMR